MIRKWVERLALVAFSITLSLVLIEFVILRGVLAYHGLESPHHIFAHDELLGWRFKPGAFGVHSSIDFKADYQVNSKGLRDTEVAYEKPPGTYRILVLGDSFTEGFGVQSEETYVEQVEVLLNEQNAQSVEVINAGVRGYSTDQQFLFLTREGIKYKPDLVILAFVSGDQNNTGKTRFRGPKMYNKPFFHLNGNELVLAGVPVPNADPDKSQTDLLEPVKNLLRPSALYTWMRMLIINKHFRPFLNELGIMKAPEVVFVEGMSSGAAAHYGSEAWQTVQYLVRDMKAEVEQYGGRLMIFLVRNDAAQPQMVESLARDLDLPFFDPYESPHFNQAREQGTIRFRHDIHWNAYGHRLAGELLSDYITTHFIQS